MPYTFTLPTIHNSPPQDEDPLELGEDVCLLGGSFTITPAGDWGVVSQVAAARQSVLRELPANPGSFVRRPEWGGGLSGKLFKGSTSASRDESAARAKARLRANPRISRVREVTTQVTEDGFVLSVNADARGGLLQIDNEVIKP